MTARLVALILVALAHIAHAQQGDTAEAGKRFNAGVALYSEADYRAALVEFKRAYDIAPNPAVLYNIGQTQYQLQDYASAYLTLTRYLAESGGAAEHKEEVTKTLATLASRIGKIDVTTNVPGAEVRIDDEIVGKTPLAAPVLVSVGRRKVEVTLTGREPQSRIIDVAAGDTVRQEIALQEPNRDKPMPITTPDEQRKSKLAPALWVTTSVLAVAAIATGVVAFRASSKLDDLRGQFPVDRADLQDQADKVKLYSRLGDGLGIAAIAAGGLALTVTILNRPTKETSMKVGVIPGGLVVGRAF